MTSVRIQQYFFFAVLIAAGAVGVMMLLPFFTPLLIALVLSVIFYPLHKKISEFFSKGNTQNSFSALISLVIVLFIVLIPLLLVGAQVSIEAKGVYQRLSSGTSQIIVLDKINEVIFNVSSKFLSNPEETTLSTLDISNYVEQTLRSAFTRIDSIFSGAAKIFFDIFILILAMFYFFRDGENLKKHLIFLSPLGDSDDKKIFNKLQISINSIIRGTLLVAIIQGILSSLGFLISGVPNPVLWGSVAVIAALIPGIGTALVLIPAIIYLFVVGNISGGIILAIWSFLAVGLIDNFLTPKLIGKSIGIHPFLILLSVIGGLSIFGPVGFIAGPLVVSFLFSLIDIYKTESSLSSS